MEDGERLEISEAKTKTLISCGYYAADLLLCFLHMPKAGFLIMWLI